MTISLDYAVMPFRIKTYMNTWAYIYTQCNESALTLAAQLFKNKTSEAIREKLIEKEVRIQIPRPLHKQKKSETCTHQKKR